jgi:tRNA A58 N-methylase Trm61
MVFHIALKTKIKKAVGVEFEPKRLQYAFKHVEENPQLDNVEFIEGDFTEVDLSDATVVYIDNTVMPHSVIDKVYDKLPTGCLLITAQNYRGMSEQTKKQIPRNYSTSKLNYLIKD